jgi:hypothetical protein
MGDAVGSWRSVCLGRRALGRGFPGGWGYAVRIQGDGEPLLVSARWAGRKTNVSYRGAGIHKKREERGNKRATTTVELEREAVGTEGQMPVPVD